MSLESKHLRGFAQESMFTVRSPEALRQSDIGTAKNVAGCPELSEGLSPARFSLLQYSVDIQGP